MRKEFEQSLTENQAAFGVDLSETQIELLANYYDFVQEHNALLHLVAPCSAEEFAVRHVLESLVLLSHLPSGVRFADVGAGAGLPSIPCLVVRDDLSALLIESRLKKARFLESAVQSLGLTSRAAVVDRQFEETDISGCKFVTSRALDKFTERLPRLLKWAKGKTLLLFGGENLAAALQQAKRPHIQELIPLSERRYLLIVER